MDERRKQYKLLMKYNSHLNRLHYGKMKNQGNDE